MIFNDNLMWIKVTGCEMQEHVKQKERARLIRAGGAVIQKRMNQQVDFWAKMVRKVRSWQVLCGCDHYCKTKRYRRHFRFTKEIIWRARQVFHFLGFPKGNILHFNMGNNFFVLVSDFCLHSTFLHCTTQTFLTPVDLQQPNMVLE